jgi:hypothetical protein
MKSPERQEREAAALRANLLKRKEQMRRRAVADAPGPEAPRDEAGKQDEVDIESKK